MQITTAPLIDQTALAAARRQLGGNFGPVFGYLADAGPQLIAAIEAGLRDHDAALMARPAHRLRGEILPFGGLRLAHVAAQIESGARLSLELRLPPDDLIEHVVVLRPLFSETITAIKAEVLAQRFAWAA